MEYETQSVCGKRGTVAGVSVSRERIDLSGIEPSAVKGEHVSTNEGEDRAPHQRADQVPTPDYAAIGGHVASVLATAEQAASQIRHEATQEANQLREDARREAARVREEAAAALRDVQRQRMDLDNQVLEVRGAADAYAEQRRRQGDEEASEITTQAQNQAAATIAEADRQAVRIEDAAKRRGAKLERESQQAVNRLRQLAGTARELADQLEQRLAQSEPSGAGAAEETLAEALATAAEKKTSKRASRDQTASR
jgi:hypothetical protein